MGTKEKLLTLFENNKGIYFSGEEIAEKLAVSRNAIWKAVNGLRAEGYEINAIKNKGYCLSVASDILSAQGIQKYLEPISSQLKLTVLSSAESTNTLLRGKAVKGAPEGSCVVANSQTHGRGRVGRCFFSPVDTGIYLSLLLRPSQCSPREAAGLTTMAAVAMCEAIESVSNETAWIKWVNDIYVRGKKVSGILTEASFSLESGFLDYAVLGAGINVYPPKDGFPDEIKGIAGAVFDEPQDDGKNRLTAAFLNSFMKYYASRGDADYAGPYRSRSFIIGKKVGVLSSTGTKQATALDVDENCRLIVKYEDGQTECLACGEVSLDLKN